MIEPFQNSLMQRALVELLLLAIPAGVLGSLIVLRRLAFYTHAIGPAAFPALTIAAAYDFNPQVAALTGTLVFAALLEWIARAARSAYDAATGLLLVGSLALGALLASDVFHSPGQVGNLLFGTLLATSDSELALTALLTIVVLVTLKVYGRNWIATAFDTESARSLGITTRRANRVLLLLVAAGIVMAVAQVGALLVSALFVIPATTVRLFAHSVRTLMLATTALAIGEGVLALWLAYQLNAPPGATLTLVSALVFTLAALAQLLAADRSVAAGLSTRATS